MRVLHLVSAPTLTGPADPALGLARGQLEAGVQVHIAFDTLRSGNMADKVRASGVPHLEGLTLSTKAGLRAAWSDRRRLAALARDFDVVHAHTSHDHALAWGIGSQTLLVRSIHHERGCRRRGLQPWIYAATGGFILVAEAHRQQLLKAYKSLGSSRAVVVPGAVEVTRFRPEVDGAAVRAEMGFGPDRVVLGMVARIKPGRGHGLMLEALREARARCPQLAVALIGKGEGVPEVKAQVKALGLEAHVAWLGFRDADLPQAIAACDATVLLEQGNDASCRAVLESMACAVPVLGAGHPAIADALVGQAGLLFAPRDREALVGAMIQAATWSPAEREDWGRRGLARVLGHHTDAVRAQQVMRAYEQWGAR